MSNQQTLQQERAASAYQAVRAAKSNDYGSLVRRLPALIQQDGLAQALVFLKAKGEKHHQDAYNHISQWVMAKIAPNPERDLLDWLMSTDSGDYRRATAEALAYLNWLKRFAEAEGIGNEQE